MTAVDHRSLQVRAARIAILDHLKRCRTDLEYQLGPLKNGPDQIILEQALVGIEAAIRALDVPDL